MICTSNFLQNIKCHRAKITNYYSNISKCNLLLCRRNRYVSLVKQNSFIIGIVKGRSRSVICGYGCDQKERRRLSWETEVEEVGFEVFPE